MNNIKPQWIIGVFIVFVLWLTEMTNRPDDIPEYSEAMQQRHSKVKPLAAGKMSNSALDKAEKKVTRTRPSTRDNTNRPPANALSAYTSVDGNVTLAQEQPFSQKLSSPNGNAPRTLSQKAFQTQAKLSEY